MRRWLVVAMVGSCLLPVRTSVAQDSTGTPSAAAEAEVEVGGAASPAEQRRERDASSNRNFLFPAAETTPQGDWEISDYELFLLTVAYGILDRLQASVTFFPPLLKDQPFFVWLSGKYAFVRTETLVFSVVLSFNIFSADGETALFLSLVPLLDVILGAEGKGWLSFGLSSSWLLAGPGDSEDLTDFNDTAFMLSASGGYQVASFVKLMLEIEGVAVLADGDLDFGNGVLLTYGVRFFNERLAGDIAFIRPVASDIDDAFILGLPFAAFTVRF